MNYKFKCEYCGSSELIFESWIICRQRVVVQPTGFIEYIDVGIDDDEPNQCWFICGCCHKAPLVYGDYITNESDLIDYLEMNTEETDDEAEQP